MRQAPAWSEWQHDAMMLVWVDTCAATWLLGAMGSGPGPGAVECSSEHWNIGQQQPSVLSPSRHHQQAAVDNRILMSTDIHTMRIPNIRHICDANQKPTSCEKHTINWNIVKLLKIADEIQNYMIVEIT